jgi:hypothetical protein
LRNDSACRIHVFRWNDAYGRGVAMQARDVGQNRFVSVRFKCLDWRYALSRHWTLRLTRPALSVAKDTGLGEGITAMVEHAAVAFSVLSTSEEAG